MSHSQPDAPGALPHRDNSSGVLILTICLALPLASCDRFRSSPPTASTACAQAGTSLVATFECLREHDAHGGYAALTPYIAPESRKRLLDLLLAVDSLLVANSGTQKAIRAACPEVDPDYFDLTALRDSLDLFARDLQVIRHEENGDDGTITARIGTEGKVIHLRFRREAGKWVYVPGYLAPDLASRVRDVARGLDRMTLVLSNAKQVTPPGLAREYEIRVQPKLRRLREAATSQPTSS